MSTLSMNLPNVWSGTRLLLGLCALAMFFSPTSDLTGQDDVDFVKQIKPLFEKHCMECHGPEEDGNGFRIDRKDETMEYIEADAADESYLYELMTSEDEDEVMPPPDYKHQVTDKERNLVKAWINQGAAWPDDAKFVKYVEQKPEAPENGEDKSDDPKVEEPKKPADGVKTDEDGNGDKNDAAAKMDPKTENMLKAAGSLHPAAVHLPIGLLLAAGFFALLSLRGSFVMSDCAYYCLWLGVIGAFIACVTGWFWSPMQFKGTVETFGDIFDTSHKVYWHRLGAMGIAIAGLVIALFAASARYNDPEEGVMWKFGAILLAIAVAWVGHTGGELQYGTKHYKYLNQVWADLTGGDAVDQQPDEKADEKAGKAGEGDSKAPNGDGDGKSPDDDNSEVGKTTS